MFEPNDDILTLTIPKVLLFRSLLGQKGARTFPRMTHPRLAVTQNAITQKDKTQTALNPDCLLPRLDFTQT